MTRAVSRRGRRSGRCRVGLTLLALALLLGLCAHLTRPSASAHAAPTPTDDDHDKDGDNDDDDDDHDDDDAFDFVSATLESTCDAAGGECQRPDQDDDRQPPPSPSWRSLTTTPRVRDVLAEHAHTRNDRDDARATSPARETLGFVTPWNGRGYDLARRFRRRFTYVAPVWLQIREDRRQRPTITGTHDIDRPWLAALRGADADAEGGPKIVPRVVYERNSLRAADIPEIATALVRLAEAEGFDGYVLEIPVVEQTIDFLLRVGAALIEADKLLLVVLSRASNEGQLPVPAALMDDLLPFVHRFTLNAYDFQLPGPNAPFPWLEAIVRRLRPQERAKLLIGLPFYGYDNRDAIVGSTYLENLQQHHIAKLRWDPTAHECYHRYAPENGGQSHAVYYPCLQFLQDRLELFAQAGVAGVSIWELGQGLDYFFDLL